MNAIGPMANMPPPDVVVEIPVDWRSPADPEFCYQFAGPIFLCSAVFFCGWWLIRHGTMNTQSGRVMLLACAGSLAASYTAFWIWGNRNSVISQRNLDASLAANMPCWWINFYLAFDLCGSMANSPTLAQRIGNNRKMAAGIARRVYADRRDCDSAFGADEI
jgi:hypothetical protein